MSKIQVEESALDSIKRMAQQLQDERDILIDAINWAANQTNEKEKDKAINDALLLALGMCLEPQEIIEKQKEPA